MSYEPTKQDELNRIKLNENDLENLSVYWPAVTPWLPRSTGWGTINQTFLVGDEADLHILKLYGRNTNPAQIGYGHRILLELGQGGLPFLVPAPRPAASGETLLPVARTEGVLASVFPVLHGEIVRRGEPGHAHQAGAAMGALHQGLSALDIAPEDAVLPPWGDLARVHPLVPNPFAIVEELGLEADTTRELNTLILEVMEAVASLADLPRQITHADFLWPNLLFCGGLVSAVLDFEFATYDLRAFDLAGSLYHFGMLPWEEDKNWGLLEAFGGGYGGNVSLTQGEIEAMPMLLRWQRLGCLIYWMGVYRQGLTSRQSVVNAVEENLLLEKWLLAHGQKLVERSHAWFSITQ